MFKIICVMTVFVSIYDFSNGFMPPNALAGTNMFEDDDEIIIPKFLAKKSAMGFLGLGTKRPHKTKSSHPVPDNYIPVVRGKKQDIPDNILQSINRRRQQSMQNFGNHRQFL